MKKVMIVASNGGHLVQLLRLFPAFKSYEITLVSTSETRPSLNEEFNYLFVDDCNFKDKLGLIKTTFQLFKIVSTVRPDIVVTTGAAPGLLSIFLNKMFLKKGIWIDSIANTERLSLSGKYAKKITPFCYSQWEDVAKKENVKFIGAVI